MIELKNVPSLLTIQDSGRKGYRKLGVPVSGFMDDVSARLANYLAGNSGDTPLLEFVLAGPTILFHGPSVFSVAGDVEVLLNGVPIKPWRSYWAGRGDVLEVGRLRSGVYGYIAFAGGIKCRKILGSCSTYGRAGLGEPLKKGDRLELGYSILTGREGREIPEELRPDYRENRKKVRVIIGPDREHFSEDGIETFLNSYYTVSPESDRMGYRLDGPKVEHRGSAGIITSPVLPGTVQVPASGQPIVMMRDSQTTGGYARIAGITTSDFHVIAQTRPGEKVKFEAVSISEALSLLRKQRSTLEFLRRTLEAGGRIYRIRAKGTEFISMAYSEETKNEKV